MSQFHLLLGVLSPAQKRSLGNQLSLNLQDPSSALALAQIYSELDTQDKLEADANILAFFKDSIGKGESRKILKHDQLLVLGKASAVASDLLNWIQNILIFKCNSRLNFIFDDEVVSLFRTFIETEGIIELDLDFDLQSILCFLEDFYALESSISLEKLNLLICILTSAKDEVISSEALKILRWVKFEDDTLMELIWDLIPTMMISPSSSCITNAYIIWLRFLTYVSGLGTTARSLQTNIAGSNYWRYIQNGLISSVHEQRKYSMSILKLSLLQLDFDISNEYIEFNIEEKEKSTHNWERFCTLFEIIGIDTALNQAEAARSDILSFLSLKSPIPSSWGLTLLSTTFKASMESVRKFGLSLMYSIPPEDLSILAHETLTTVFLPFAVDASLFVVTKDSRNLLKCKYGTKLRIFITDLLESIKHDVSLLKSTMTLILTLMVELIPTFAPARVYLSLGLLNGLKRSEIMEAEHLKLLYRLFESNSEDVIFQKTLQTIHIRLISNMNPNLESFLKALTTFVKFNGYLVFNENLELLLDYASKNFEKEVEFQTLKTQDVDYQCIVGSIFGKFECSNEFLIEWASSGLESSRDFSKEYSILLTSLINGSNKNYKNSHFLCDLDIFNNSWKNVNLENLFSSLLTSEFDFDQLCFFAKAYENVSESSYMNALKFEGVSKLHKVLVQVETDYKGKDHILAWFFNCLLSFMKTTALSSDEVLIVLKWLHEGTRFCVFKGVSAICEVLNFLLSTYDLEIVNTVKILETLWDQITAERLVLNQREMHVKLIQTLFHEKILIDSINNEYNQKIILRIGLQIIEQGFSRRTFLPGLTLSLLKYHQGYPEEFERTLWLIELLLRCYSQTHDSSNLFNLKTVIAKLFDDKLSYVGDLYDEVYGSEEVSARINIAVVLISVSKSFASEYFELILSSSKYHILTPLKKADGDEELKRIAAFETLLLVAKNVDSVRLSLLTSDVILPALVTEPSPLVRTYMEWIMAIDMVHSEPNRKLLFTHLQDQTKPSLVTSVERIAFLVAQKLTLEQATPYFAKFCEYLICNCTSNRPLIRHFSNSLILSVYPYLQSNSIELTCNEILKLLYIEAKKSEITGQYRSGDALVWDAEKEFTLTGICGGVLSRISPRSIRSITEKEFKRYISTKISDSLSVSIGSIRETVLSQPDDFQDTEASTINVPLQTKSGAWETVLNIDEQDNYVNRSDLIVVSSLVDKPPNLGGICRLCDVLGAGLMTVDDLRVKKHPQFKNVAVTADYWMPIAEVKIADIAGFLKQKKKEGYTLIGLEQTDKSIILGNETQFPAKSVILLGKEAEGIPGDLLAEMDYCIEIRQLGVVRSMNIQTAAAVIVHAYASSQN